MRGGESEEKKLAILNGISIVYEKWFFKDHKKESIDIFAYPKSVFSFFFA